MACSAQVGESSDRGAGSVLVIDPAFDAIVPPDANIEKLHGGFVFVEGPVWVDADGGGYLLFSDIPANVVYKWTPAGELTRFVDPVTEEGSTVGGEGGSNGLTLDAEGRLILCEHGNRRLARLEDDGTRVTLADYYDGKRLNSPNDAVLHSDGSLYFTDPPFGLPKQNYNPAKELPFSGIFRLRTDGSLELLERGLSAPNGIALSPDEKTLYVANSDAEQKVWMAYDVENDGTLGTGRVFFDASAATEPGVPDGMKVDRAGNVYATGPGGVWVFSPEGRHLGTIRPDEIPANVGWGDDGRTLYMTAHTALYRIRLNAEGVRP
jgi:gluconolactonase